MRCLLLSLAAALLLNDGRSTSSSRVVGVADLHGDFDHTVQLLEAAGLVEANVDSVPLVSPDDGRAFSKYRGVRWIGGNATLVQTGDLVDRGTFARDLYALFADLRAQAPLAGGRVVNLIGNHDMMNMIGDLRYVSKEDYMEFGGKDLRSAAFAPTGWIGRQILEEFASAFVASETLFVHAGLTPAFAREHGIEGLNAATREQLLAAASASSSHDQRKQFKGPLLGSKGPFWVRHFARGRERQICDELAETLALVGATRMVVGHTQVDEGSVRSRCSGALLMADTIISKSAYPECWQPRSMQVEGCEGSLSYVEILGDGAIIVKYPKPRQQNIDKRSRELSPDSSSTKRRTPVLFVVATLFGGGILMFLFFPSIRLRLTGSSDDQAFLTHEDIAGQNDYLLKCVIIGDSSVGKSSLLRLFAGEELDAKLPPTAGVDFRIVDNVDVSFEDVRKTARVQLWDCSGDTRYEPITEPYIRGRYPIVVFELARRDSFNSLQTRWAPRLESARDVGLLVGTMADSAADVSDGLVEEAQHWADARGWRFVQLSVETLEEVVARGMQRSAAAQAALQNFARTVRRDCDGHVAST